jgi:hypothetical protein
VDDVAGVQCHGGISGLDVLNQLGKSPEEVSWQKEFRY